MTVSDELVKTSILLKEAWHEGIEEAWKSYRFSFFFNYSLFILIIFIEIKFKNIYI